MKTSGKTAMRFARTALGLIALFTLLLTLVYCIPAKWVESRQALSIEMVGEESEWAEEGNLYRVISARQDYYTDTVMLERVLAEDEQLSPLGAAMSMNGYGRYWHGYMVLLRPLLLLFSLQEIRYILMWAFFLLTGAAVVQIERKLPGGACAFAFLASLVACYIVIIPTSLQYSWVFLVLLTASLLLLLHCDRMDESGAALLFMAVGMVTNFVDLLTVPLLTLGIPLLLLLELDMHRRGEERVRVLLRRAVCCTFAWCVGFGLCWIAKWCIGSIVLGENVFSSAQDRASMWLGIDVAEGNWRLATLVNNFITFFLPHGRRMLVWLLAPAAAYAVCLARFRHPHWRRALVLLPVCAYPYIWYAVFSYHSFCHTWFTYRTQAMTLMGALLFLAELVDWKRCREAFAARRGRKSD